MIYDLFNLAICFSISHSITLTWKIKFKDEKFATIFNSVQCSFITLKKHFFSYRINPISRIFLYQAYRLVTFS